MKFAALLKQSLVDYPREDSCGAIYPGAVICAARTAIMATSCSNRAGPTIMTWICTTCWDSCRNGPVFLDGVVISGGEPTLNPDLDEACRAIKALGYLVKLDTNGTRFTALAGLIEKGLVDYVAMDIKAALEYQDYLEACGRLSREDFFNVRSSVHLLKNTSIQGGNSGPPWCRYITTSMTF